MTKILLKLNDEAEKILDNLVNKNQSSKAEILRQGLILRDIYQKETDGNKIMAIVDPEKKEIEKQIVLVK